MPLPPKPKLTIKNDVWTPTFNEFVDWAAWEVVTGLLSGTPIRSTVFMIVSTSRNIKFKEEKG